MIKSIHIKNVKGIEDNEFKLDIIPNKPSILVAPNGFGKSSIATAFKSLKRTRIDLDEDYCFKGNVLNKPTLNIEYKNSENIVQTLAATHNSNNINTVFGVYVINNALVARGISSPYGGRASARMEIKNTVIVDRIPDTQHFEYSINFCKSTFGANSKILPNISIDILRNKKLISNITKIYDSMDKISNKRVQDAIHNIINQINDQGGSKEIILSWIQANLTHQINNITYVKNVSSYIQEYTDYNEIDAFLSAIQLHWIYQQNKSQFKSSCKYQNYLLDKEYYQETLSSFNSTWKDIRISESGNKLILRFPEAKFISNGQRDILTFISSIFRAKEELNKEYNILIIDEVFDYLDDANLISAQYHITKLINTYKKSGKKLYPIILTHLNPYYFKNFAFNDQKVYYLNKSTANVHDGLVKLIKKRTDPTIKEDVSKYLLHYHTGHINKRAEFEALGIPPTWGELDNFRRYIDGELQKYINEQNYDPFAVCTALRVKIEEIVYNKIREVDKRTEFLATYKTREKLDFANNIIDFIIPEPFYLLGIIYNDCMHWRSDVDNISPISSKLENLTIKKMIKDISKHS